MYIVNNFTDAREAIEVTWKGQQVMEDTIAADENDWMPGQNKIIQTTEKKEFHFIVNGKDQSDDPKVDSQMHFTAIRCIGECNDAIVEEEEVEEEVVAEFRMWSDVTNWPNEILPADGDTVEIKSGWKMILDIPETPKIKLLNVNGILIFSDEMDITLNAFNIFVRAGELHIGNETHPHNH